MAAQTGKFKAAVKRAKKLYKTGRYKTFADAVKAAWKGAKVGATRKKANRQTGSTHRKADKKRKAKAPGKRISKSGNVYNERRRNRSDVPGTLAGHVSAAKQLIGQRIAALELAKFKAPLKRSKRQYAKRIAELKKQYKKLV